MTIYLYVKTHSKTGIKYLGKTTKDPYKYIGSGVKWHQLLKQHGAEHTTEIIKECNSNHEINVWGRHYSTLWDVVASDQWANLIPETGGGGPWSINRKKVDIRGNKNPMFGKHHTEDLKQRSSIRRAQTNAARKWWNNGTDSKFLKECPDGWQRGRVGPIGAQRNRL